MIGMGRRFEARLAPAHVFAITALVLLALHAGALRDPPYWDTLMGAFPQGLWLARNGFDVVGLLTEQPTCPQGGPNVYPFSVYPLLVGALYALDLAPTNVFLVLHLISIASAAACAASVYAIARRHLAAPIGLLSVLVLVSAPLFQSLAAQMDMDMPLCACTFLALDAFDRRRFLPAWGWALAALVVHPRGVVVALGQTGALGACALSPSLARRFASGASGACESSTRGWMLAHVGLLLLFAAEVLVQAGLSSTSPHLGAFVGFVEYARSALTRVPEFGVLFALAAIAAVLALRARAGWTAFHLACFVLAYVAFFGQVTNCLPRYFLQAYPHVLLLLFVRVPPRTGTTATLASGCVLAITANVLNHSGRFYPVHPSGWSVPGYAKDGLASNDGHVLERSMEYRDDLSLDLAIARHLERFERERTVVVANWPLTYCLAIPEFGYVERAWRTSSQNPLLSFDPLGVPLRDLYDTSTRPYRKRLEVDAVWVLVPNDFIVPHLALQPRIDVVTAVLERGSHHAFVFRRVGWDLR